ncbi:MAG TPA: GNAT family N-acetyltransferase [Kofleriaceae bacterium]|nr:GNAT family N-acetyltransferase [Kofleriaceae bacterium]
MTITYREATIADAEALARMHRHAVGGYAGVYEPTVLDAWNEGHTTARWEARISSPALFVIAELDGELVGCGGLVDNRTGLYVHPQAQRRGIARTIFADLEARARRRGITLLELSAPEPAVPFYTAMGFERLTAKAQRFGERAALTVVDMQKHLT